MSDCWRNQNCDHSQTGCSIQRFYMNIWKVDDGEGAEGKRMLGVGNWGDQICRQQQSAKRCLDGRKELEQRENKGQRWQGASP